MEVTSAELLARFEAGDGAAADALFERYVERLTRLARARLSPRLARRVDPEDVVHSAYRSFFVAAQQGRFSLEQRGDLWRLLVRITLHKLYRTAAHHRAEMRSIDREGVGGQADSFLAQQAGREPTAEAAALLADEVQWLFAELPPGARRALELRLQGATVAEIANDVEHSPRHVRRLLAMARERMTQRQREFGIDVDDEAFRRVRCADRNSRDASESDWSAQRTLRAKDTTHVSDAEAPLRYADYLLVQLLGSGGVGKVYRAVQRPTGAAVAVKFLRKAFFTDPHIVPRFVAEAQVVGRLKHPGIVAVHGLGKTPHGGLFMAMDLIDGPNLEAVATTELPSPVDVARWIAQAARVMDDVHRQKVVHCDLKPSNLLLAPDGEIRVTDFGFARSLNDAAAGQCGLAGTAAYMAPEQIDAHWGPIGPPTDVYGLGAVMFRLLTGRAVAEGRRLADLLAAVVTTNPQELRTHFPAGVSEPLRDCCLRCLDRAADNRYPTAAALAAALTAAID